MQHKIPEISEVSLRILNLDFFKDVSINSAEIKHNISINTKINTLDKIHFLIAVRYFLEKETSPFDTLFEADYVATIDVKNAITAEKSEKYVDTEKLAHLLGMSLLMIRGAISIRLVGNMLNETPLPTISPLDLLKSKLTIKENKFVVSSDEEE